jgi:hypothetical protein
VHSGISIFLSLELFVLLEVLGSFEAARGWKQNGRWQDATIAFMYDLHISANVCRFGLPFTVCLYSSMVIARGAVGPQNPRSVDWPDLVVVYSRLGMRSLTKQSAFIPMENLNSTYYTTKNLHADAIDNSTLLVYHLVYTHAISDHDWSIHPSISPTLLVIT